VEKPVRRKPKVSRGGYPPGVSGPKAEAERRRRMETQVISVPPHASKPGDGRKLGWPPDGHGGFKGLGRPEERQLGGTRPRPDVVAVWPEANRRSAPKKIPAFSGASGARTANRLSGRGENPQALEEELWPRNSGKFPP